MFQIVGVTSSCLPSDDLKDVLSESNLRAMLTVGWLDGEAFTRHLTSGLKTTGKEQDKQVHTAIFTQLGSS